MFPFFSKKTFERQYAAYSMSLVPQCSPSKILELEQKGYIILPVSALSELSYLEIQLPMVFRIFNSTKKESYSGVLEFIAEEGRVYMPQWMLETLLIKNGTVVTISNVTLPVGEFVKFQPQSCDFLDISDPKAVLETSLRSFSCLTEGDIIPIFYNKKVYNLKVVETAPQKAIKIIECDLQVDFCPPLGYVEPTYSPPKKCPEKCESESTPSYFSGNSYRIRNKKTNEETKEREKSSPTETNLENESFAYISGYFPFPTAKDIERFLNSTEKKNEKVRYKIRLLFNSFPKGTGFL